MDRNFSEILSGIRHEKGISQRKAAADLKISQALLSHYENGAREPGLCFVCRACDYYGITADELLGRSESSGSETFPGLGALQEALRDRGSAEVESSVGKYISAASRRLCADIYGLADALTLSRLALEQAEAERAIVEAFPSAKPVKEPERG